MTTKHGASRLDAPARLIGACPVAGEWVSNNAISPAAATAAYTQSLAIYIPVWMPWAVPFDQWSVYCTTAGGTGSVTRVGLYAPTLKGRPGALIADLGTVDTSSVGSKVATVAGTIPAGLSFICVVSQGNTALKLWATQPSSQFVIPLPSAFAGTAASSFAEFRQSGVTGALPSTATATPVALAPAVAQTPLVAFRMGNAVNKIVNPAVGVDGSGWTNGTRTAVSGFARPYAMTFTGSTATAFMETARAACAAAETWTISASVRCSDAMSGSRTYIEYYNSAGTFLSEAAVQTEAVAAGVVKRVSRTVTTPANCAFISMAFYFELPTTGSVVAMTMARATKTGATGYFDGDSLNWAWDGTAGLSTSSGGE